MPALLSAVAMTVALAVSPAQANSAKRGFAGGNEQMITGLNASWYYTWWTDPTPGVTTAEFVPIMQNQWAVGAATQYNNNPNVKAVLGFNEPERPDQANLTVNAALDLWAQTQASNKELVSPAPSDTGDGRAWLQSFMSGASGRGYRVDAVAFHWYGDTRGGASSAASFLGAVDWYHNTFNKPVWITEFGGIDWSGTNPISQDTNKAFLQAAVAGLESRSYVERYSWYQWDPECRLMNDDLSLTTIGDFYTGNTIVASGQTMDLNTMAGGNTGNDVWYLRGGTVTNTGTAAGHFMRRVDVTTASIITGSNNWSMQDYYLRVEPGSGLSKTGANTIDFQNLKFDNNGSFTVSGGTLRLRGGVTVAGSGGTFRVGPGAALALSSDSQATANNVALPVQLLGGILRSDDNRQTLAGQLNVLASSSVNTVGELILSQPMIGVGKINKTGANILRLTALAGSTARTGAMDVQAGTLMLQGLSTTAPMLGSGTLNVASGAKVGGIGLSGAGATTISGEIAPGLSDTSPGTLRFGGDLTLASTARLSIDAASGSGDRVLLTAAAPVVTIAGTLAFHANAGFDATAYGTSFDLVTTPAGYTGKFATILAPAISDAKSFAVTYGATSITATIARPGDTNLSGGVDFADLLTLAKSYGIVGGEAWANGDFTGEGRVDFSDLLLVAKNYGVTNAADTAALAGATSSAFAADFALAQSLAPEPTTLLGLLAVAPLVTRRRTRSS